MTYYILNDNNEVVPTNDVNEFGQFMSSGRKVVLQEQHEGLFISTVFLGLDHGDGAGEPIVFETMIFQGGSYSEIYARRYCTFNDAVIGHHEVMNRLELDGWDPLEN